MSNGAYWKDLGRLYREHYSESILQVEHKGHMHDPGSVLSPHLLQQGQYVWLRSDLGSLNTRFHYDGLWGLF